MPPSSPIASPLSSARPAVPPSLVVDCSAIAAFLFDEPEGSAVKQTIDGADLVAPTFLPVELGHVCLKKMRRSPDSAARLMIAYGARDMLGIVLHEVDHDAVLHLAATSALSFYDSCYLWLSRRLGVELITLDKQLAAAARSLALRA